MGDILLLPRVPLIASHFQQAANPPTDVNPQGIPYKHIGQAIPPTLSQRRSKSLKRILCRLLKHAENPCELVVPYNDGLSCPPDHMDKDENI
jgi:hypothetical protein